MWSASTGYLTSHPLSNGLQRKTLTLTLSLVLSRHTVLTTTNKIHLKLKKNKH